MGFCSADSDSAASMVTGIKEDDSESVAKIKELLETCIRPQAQDKGRDFEYVGFDPERGEVTLRMQRCDYTLIGSIEVILMNHVPEVKSVTAEWTPEMKFASVLEIFTEPLILDLDSAASKDTAIKDDGSETVGNIRSLLQLGVREAAQINGGDIECVGFDPETGTARLRMHGDCNWRWIDNLCRFGLEKYLIQCVPGVKSVQQEFDTGQEEQDVVQSGAPHE